MSVVIDPELSRSKKCYRSIAAFKIFSVFCKQYIFSIKNIRIYIISYSRSSVIWIRARLAIRLFYRNSHRIINLYQFYKRSLLV